MPRIPIPLEKINKLLPILEAEERALAGKRRAIEEGNQPKYVEHLIEMKVLNDRETAVFTQGES